MINKILTKIKEYRLRSLDAGVFQKLVIEGANFEINSFELVGAGRVATMCASRLFGMVKRDTLIISPMEKDAAVITYERLKAFRKDSILIARYDMKNEAEYIKKEGKKKQSEEFDQEVERIFENYLQELRSAVPCEQMGRKAEIEKLVTLFIEESKLSSDIFFANYGMEITEKLYHQVMFGTREN